MLENKYFEGIHYSRFIASWFNVAGDDKNYLFEDWLEQLEINGKHMSEDVIRDIKEMKNCGKLELEGSVRSFLIKTE